MAIDKNFTFPEKELGLLGNLDYTWNLDIHWPVLTLDYLENMTGINLSSKKGSNELAQTELLKIAKLSKLFLFNKLPHETKRKLEYKIAKDQDALYEVLEYQTHIFEAGFVDGAWLTMYNTEGKETIGPAAEQFLKSSTLLTYKWGFNLNDDDYRKDY